jgi:hypothetical protein
LVKDTVKNLDLVSIVFLLFGTVAGIAAIYYLLGIVREWFRRRHRTGKDTIRGTNVTESILDGHIAAQWTEGRLRLDSLLGLIKKLRASLEQEVEMLRRLDHSDPLYEREARNNVAPALRRFTFDKHLREECRVLVPLLQFCAQDLAETQGLDMTQKLSVLAEIQAAIKSVDSD